MTQDKNIIALNHLPEGQTFCTPDWQNEPGGQGATVDCVEEFTPPTVNTPAEVV